MITVTVFFIPKTVTVPVAIYDSFLTCLFYSTHIPMFTVLDPLLEFTYHLLSCWRKFALCIQSLLCMLYLSGWPQCQRSDTILMEVSQRAYDMIMIHYISGLFGYFCVCEIYVNLIWYLYLFMLDKLYLSLSLSLSLVNLEIPVKYWESCTLQLLEVAISWIYKLLVGWPSKKKYFDFYVFCLVSYHEAWSNRNNDTLFLKIG